ncbi:galactose-6-phosphate isomerase subunit LacA [Thermoactinomyces mirandus]|uniref:Galactose-6-phosphate isomerase subunit LacA n=1 Tax=Thermoactinomyces mirandus TaxID=2756294 RepID=A0A7W1XS92_9BACL|nr:galactose-6-phosphate isomerase subunit LacA [Thermoactinomyces mirandus]MBA4602338.1 galactose-6-phosphate isomerase subunit LacA [Thermoactinomyces mirandus]
MKIAIGSDDKGFELKTELKGLIESLGHEVLDETPENDLNFVESAKRVAEAIRDNKADRGIVIDEYGVGSFMVANKYKGIICANVCNEHSAQMTRRHNKSTIVTIGSGIVGKTLAKKICKVFINQKYDGGRHQIRVDMLNKMC